MYIRNLITSPGDSQQISAGPGGYTGIPRVFPWDPVESHRHPWGILSGILGTSLGIPKGYAGDTGEFLDPQGTPQGDSPGNPWAILRGPLGILGNDAHAIASV